METSDSPKVSSGELVLYGLGLLLVDGACALLDLTGIGAVITPFIQSAFTAGMTAWFSIAKKDKEVVKLGRQILKYAANLLPWIPTLFIVFIAESLIHNRNRKVASPAVAESGGEHPSDDTP